MSVGATHIDKSGHSYTNRQACKQRVGKIDIKPIIIFKEYKIKQKLLT